MQIPATLFQYNSELAEADVDTPAIFQELVKPQSPGFCENTSTKGSSALSTCRPWSSRLCPPSILHPVGAAAPAGIGFSRFVVLRSPLGDLELRPTSLHRSEGHREGPGVPGAFSPVRSPRKSGGSALLGAFRRPPRTPRSCISTF